jgi:hypothetical protein
MAKRRRSRSLTRTKRTTKKRSTRKKIIRRRYMDGSKTSKDSYPSQDSYGGSAGDYGDPECCPPGVTPAGGECQRVC